MGATRLSHDRHATQVIIIRKATRLAVAPERVIVAYEHRTAVNTKS